MADGLSTCEFDEEGQMEIEPMQHPGQDMQWSKNGGGGLTVVSHATASESHSLRMF